MTFQTTKHWLRWGAGGMTAALALAAAHSLARPESNPGVERCYEEGQAVGAREGQSRSHNPAGAIGEAIGDDLESLKRALERSQILQMEAQVREACQEAGHESRWNDGFRDGYDDGYIKDAKRLPSETHPSVASDGLGNPRTVETAPGEGRGEPLGAQSIR